MLLLSVFICNGDLFQNASSIKIRRERHLFFKAQTYGSLFNMVL